MITDVTLSSGATIKVKRLGLFALDKVQVQPLGPYTYAVTAISGETYTVLYDGARWKEPPPRPAGNERETREGTDLWYAWREYHLYQGWLAHERLRSESMVRYAQEVADYILTNAVAPEDVDTIETPEDWSLVHRAALVPELTEEVLSATLRTTFHSLVARDGDPGSAEAG
jgi:hypothetical protein